MTSANSRIATTIGLIVLFCLLGILSPSPGLAQNNTDAFISEQVALVDGDNLTEQELFFTLLREYGGDMIYDLVENEIIADYADELNVSLEPNEVVEYLTGAYAPEKLEALINSFGEDLLEYAVGSELLAFRVVTAKIDQVVTENDISVSDELIQDFYIDYLPAWTEPAAVRFSLIETATQTDALAARDRVLAGEEFAEVCREVSTHPSTRVYGGDIGGMVPEGYSRGERARLEDAAFDLEIGEVGSPIQVEDKWYIITTTAKSEYNEPTLDEMRDFIHATLLDRRVEPYLEAWREYLWSNAVIVERYPIYTGIDNGSFSAGTEGSFIAPVVAEVNGTEIPEGALFFHLLRQNGSDVVEALIENILLTRQGDAMGVNTPASEAEATLGEIYEADTLEILYEAFGRDALVSTMQRELNAIGVMGSKIQQIVEDREIEITPEEILDYYLNNLHLWTTAERVKFSMILVDSEDDAAAARQRILSGETFETVCRDVSTDEGTRAYGGDIGDYITRNTAVGPNVIIEDTAFDLPVGGVSEPFQVTTSWFVIKTTDHVDAYEPTLAEMTTEIRTRLLQDRVAPFVFGWRRDIWEAADITVVYPIYSDDPSPEFTQ